MEGASGSFRGASEQRAAALGIDRMSLESRAVRAMLGVNPKRARDLFLFMQKPVPRRLTCADFLAEHPAPYYDALSAVVASLDSDAKRKGVHARLAESVVAAIPSPEQIAPAAAVLSLELWKPAELDLLVTKFAGAVTAMSSDDRSFMMALPGQHQAVAALLARLDRQGVEGREALRVAYRDFLLRHINAERCAESTDRNLPYIRAEFAATQAFGISPSERKPRTTDARADTDTLLRSDGARRLEQRWRTLLYDGLPEAQWRDELDAYLRDVDALKAPDAIAESPIEEMKMKALAGLLLGLPPGDQRERVLARYLGELQSSPEQERRPGPWFLGVTELLEAPFARNADERERLLGQLEATGHPVLVLTARLERVAPRSSFGPPRGSLRTENR
jgi:hypothetical protein